METQTLEKPKSRMKKVKPSHQRLSRTIKTLARLPHLLQHRPCNGVPSQVPLRQAKHLKKSSSALVRHQQGRPWPVDNGVSLLLTSVGMDINRSRPSLQVDRMTHRPHLYLLAGNHLHRKVTIRLPKHMGPLLTPLARVDTTAPVVLVQDTPVSSDHLKTLRHLWNVAALTATGVN